MELRWVSKISEKQKTVEDWWDYSLLGGINCKYFNYKTICYCYIAIAISLTVYY